MNKKILFVLWGGLFALCAGLGFLPEPAGVLKGLMVLLAVAFFVPPLMLIRRKERKTLHLIRSLSALSLALTVVLLICNFLTVFASETVGNFLYSLLIIVSSPMVCGQYWALGLFGWAYLMSASHSVLKKAG